MRIQISRNPYKKAPVASGPELVRREQSVGVDILRCFRIRKKTEGVFQKCGREAVQIEEKESKSIDYLISAVESENRQRKCVSAFGFYLIEDSLFDPKMTLTNRIGLIGEFLAGNDVQKSESVWEYAEKANIRPVLICHQTRRPMTAWLIKAGSACTDDYD